jgi:hypothetical protein
MDTEDPRFGYALTISAPDGSRVTIERSAGRDGLEALVSNDATGALRLLTYEREPSEGVREPEPAREIIIPSLEA